MNLQNHFLIAMPSLTDPYFDHSVVYICEHNENGAMGLVINKPIEDFSVATMLKKLEIDVSDNTNTRNLEKMVLRADPFLKSTGLLSIPLLQVMRQVCASMTMLW